MTKVGLLDGWEDKVPARIMSKYPKSSLIECQKDELDDWSKVSKRRWIECQKDENGDWFEKDMSSSSSASASWIECQTVSSGASCIDV